MSSAGCERRSGIHGPQRDPRPLAALRVVKQRNCHLHSVFLHSLSPGSALCRVDMLILCHKREGKDERCQQISIIFLSSAILLPPCICKCCMCIFAKGSQCSPNNSLFLTLQSQLHFYFPSVSVDDLLTIIQYILFSCCLFFLYTYPISWKQHTALM